MWITCSAAFPTGSDDGHPPPVTGPSPEQPAVRTVLIRAEAGTSVGAIAAALATTLATDQSGSARPPSGRHLPPTAARLAREPTPSIHVDGVEVPPERRLDASPLRDGSLVGLGSPLGPGWREPLGLLDVRVTGGPGAGMVHRLAAGEYGVGADPLGGVVLSDPAAPPRALVLRVNVDGSCSLTPADGVDVWIDGCHRTGPVFLSARRSPNDRVELAVRVAATSLLLTAPDEPDALLRPGRPGSTLEISREPRLARWPPDVRFRLPPLPVPQPAPPLPVLAAILPALAAGGMALLLQAPYLLLFAALAPLSLLGSHLAGRRHSARDHRRALAEYQLARMEVDRAAAAALDQESAVRREAHPDPAAVLLRAVGPRRGLWERRPEDPDFLRFRVGTGDVPSGVTLEDPAAPDHRRTTRWMLREVPVTVAMPEVGVLGVVGTAEFARVVGFWLVAQAATLHSPRDLSIHLVVGPTAAADWEWARWLPHCRPADGPPGAVLIGADPPGRARRAEELARLAEARMHPAEETRGGGVGRGHSEPAGPPVLVVVEGAAALRGALIPLLRYGPRVGIHVVCLEPDPRLLPSECQAVVEQMPTGARIRHRGQAGIEGIRPDLVGAAVAARPAAPTRSAGAGAAGTSAGAESSSTRTEPGGSGRTTAAARWCERLARSLAPIRDPGHREAGEARIPTGIRLLDLLGLDPPTSRALAPRWIDQEAGAAAPLGVALSGAISLDLSRDGPHALVAGTTGAGKSELLQSLVASLAIHNRPDEMTFVLVDYKGGSAFGDCARLPHTVGLVTDLDPHLVGRALDSLGAELRRRETLFAAAGSKDLDDYRRRSRNRPDDGEAPEPLPRLVVVVDEFAALARELPDFVTGLVGLAGRGRSLGIHLVLATQRPAGVVSPEILANTNLRIALRVTDQAESMDVLGLPDAALIPVSAPGRAILRAGQGAPVVFQTARIGGTHDLDEAARAGATAGPLVIELPWPPLDRASTVAVQAEGEEGRRRQKMLTADTPDEPTDLRRLADALHETARACRVPRPRRPWLAPLPTRTTVSALPPVGPPGDPHGVPAVPLGFADLCRAQAQPTFALDLERGSHLLVLGAPRSGRSTVLRTLAGAVALTASPADVHLYGLDCGNNSLGPIADLPHTGAVVAGTEAERVHRLLARLTREVGRRQDLLAQGGYADLAESRQAGLGSTVAVASEQTPSREDLSWEERGPGIPRLPYLLLLLDSYDGFLALFEDLDGAVAVDRLLALARDGPAVGLRLVVTAERRGLTGPLASTIGQRLILRMAERADYSLAGLASLRIPDLLPPGRGFLTGGMTGSPDRAWAEADTPVEIQVALLADDPSGLAQAGALRRLAIHARESPRSKRADSRPFRIDVLPARVSPRDLAALPHAGAGAGAGAGQRRASRGLSVVLGVGGDELAPIDIDLATDGPGFVIAGPARSGRSSALLAIARGLLTHGCHLTVVSPRPSPLRGLAGQGPVQVVEDTTSPGPHRLDELLPTGRRTVLLVDDVELVTATPLGEALAGVLRGARDSEQGLVAAGTTEELITQFRGLVVEARRSRCGLLLAPGGPVEGDLFGVRLPRPLCHPAPPGRGVLVQRGHIRPIQVIDLLPVE
ncbi:DNA segregation ATPase FtsK/SpoIIIE, S-DNA-T family [Frankia sp. EI5c]|uniref:FtsK/SpoIIIE domain-containing protein n=1 Tax=Frankia sp. EI5c TaxID=683316 RepID=UPI0007C24BA7|nr:FtsK/SpoIIIE domain-containing protein [Frankia sp. EI5c]OAA26567.1 DNA segregation ATPase FtsK/SpoIIIE, S-DNA-T family [Frankia sp. EI5c]